MGDKTASNRPSPDDLWRQAGGGTSDYDDARYRALLRQHWLPADSGFPDSTDMNWELLRQFYDKPHPLIRDVDTAGLHFSIVELLHEAKAVHHLLDLIGVPPGVSLDTCDIDCRTLIAVRAVMTLRERLGRISDWHARETGPAGTVGDYCTECGHRWPCETRQMANGVHKEDTEGDGHG